MNLDLARRLRFRQCSLELFLTQREFWARRRIDAVCRGYSGPHHWLSFRRILRQAQIRRACMLGVYFGRDLAYLKTLEPDLALWGVDRFSDVPGEDWPADKRHLSWEQAGYGRSPSLEAARSNLLRLDALDGVTLVQSDALPFLRSTELRFDLIYIDVAHDYETTRDAIAAARERLEPGGLLAGDDFSDGGTWGVKTAVEEAFPECYELLGGWIWVACPDGSRSGFKRGLL